MDQTMAEIRLFAGNFAPRGWALCQGQLLAISTNTALFSLLGTTYGGDGVTTFALPDFRGRIPVGPGQGPGLTNYVLGETLGTEQYTVTTNQMPAHNHILTCNNQPAAGTLNNPVNAYVSAGPVDRSTGLPVNTRYATTANGTMAPTAVTTAGGSQPTNNIQPSLCLNYIIALEGIYPSRN